MEHQRFKLLAATGVGIVAASAAQVSYAQDAASAAQDAASAPQATDEIVVTAQKREQSASDVGISIAALNAEQLQSSGVTDIRGLAKVVSGLTVSTSFDGLPVYYIRGLGYAANQLSAAPTVSVYVDEVPLPYSAMTGGAMLDLERVEVLKGPQGTLFGNNSTGGSINFIAAKPTNAMSAGFRAEVDRFGQVSAEGFASGPVSDTLRARFAVSTTQGGAWQRSYTPGPEMKNGSADKLSSRLILDWTPSNTLRFQLNANYHYDRTEPQGLQIVQTRPSGGPGSAYVDPVYGSYEAYPLPPRDNRAADLSANPRRPFFRDDEQYQFSLRGDLDVSDEVTLTSISSYADLKFATNRDVDGSRIDIIEGGHDGTISTFSQEVRLTGDFRDIGLNVIVGGNYSNDKIIENQPYYFPHFSILPPGLSLNETGEFKSQTLAVFGNAEWAITDNLSLTAGLRYTDVKQSFDSCLEDTGDGTAAAFLNVLSNVFRSIQGLPPSSAFMAGSCITLGAAPTYQPFRYVNETSEDNVSWRAGLNFKPNEDLLIYALISRGYKAGSYPFNHNLTLEQFSHVTQEQVTAYEAGVKYSSGSLFRASAAAFYYDYKNKQIFANEPVPFLGPVSVLANIPKSKAYGFEAEATLRPVQGLTLHAAVTRVHTEIVDPGDVVLDGFGQPIDLRGEPFGNAPKWSVVFDAEYRVPVGERIELVVGGNGVYNSKAFARSETTVPFTIAPYTIFDARVGVESRSGWTATAWIRNLTNKHYWVDVNFIGEAYLRTAGSPRNYGLTFGYRF